jgi:hypothetical protein
LNSRLRIERVKTKALLETIRISHNNFGKESHGMNSMCSNQTVAAMAPSEVLEDTQKQPRASNFLYQAATVLAILLFLFSF